MASVVVADAAAGEMVFDSKASGPDPALAGLVHSSTDNKEVHHERQQDFRSLPTTSIRNVLARWNDLPPVIDYLCESTPPSVSLCFLSGPKVIATMIDEVST